MLAKQIALFTNHLLTFAKKGVIWNMFFENPQVYSDNFGAYYKTDY